MINDDKNKTNSQFSGANLMNSTLRINYRPETSLLNLGALDNMQDFLSQLKKNSTENFNKVSDCSIIKLPSLNEHIRKTTMIQSLDCY